MIGLILCIIGILAGWGISHYYFKRGMKGTVLSFEAQAVNYISKKDLGNKVIISVDDKPINTLVLIYISVSLKGSCELTEANFTKRKPALHFQNMDILDIRTINNNREQFEIPIGRADSKTCVFNINYFKRNSTANFQIIGSLHGEKSSPIKCSFTTGQGIGVTIDGSKLANNLQLFN